MRFSQGPYSAVLVVVSLIALAVGCGSDGLSQSNPGGGAGGSGAGAGANSTAGTTTSAAGTTTSAAGTSASTGGGSSEFPCEVQQLLATKCLLCHKVDPPGSMLTAADFRKPSKKDPQKTVGQVAIERLASTTAERMPPAPLEAATAAETAALTSWIQGGAMPASCGTTVPNAPDPYDTPLVCSSMKNWTGGNRESPLMRPGGACISCHKKEGEGPLFAVSGTVFQTAHEPDDCNGVSNTTGAQVVVTESNGTSHTLNVNAAGNFYLESSSFAFPYQAKVVYQGKERVMVEAQTSGDCNDCHTQNGRENAPGRIFLP